MSKQASSQETLNVHINADAQAQRYGSVFSCGNCGGDFFAIFEPVHIVEQPTCPTCKTNAAVYLSVGQMPVLQPQDAQLLPPPIDPHDWVYQEGTDTYYSRSAHLGVGVDHGWGEILYTLMSQTRPGELSACLSMRLGQVEALHTVFGLILEKAREESPEES